MSAHNIRCQPHEDAMTVIHAATALLPDGWASDVRVELAEGRIARVTPGAEPQGQRGE